MTRNPLGSLWADGTALVTGVVTTLSLPLHLRGMRFAALVEEPVSDCRGGPCARPSNVAAASGTAGRPQGPPLQSGTAADLRDSIASGTAGRPQGPPLQSGTAADLRDSIASGTAGRPQGPPLHSGTAADPRDSIASDAAGRPQGPPLHSGTAADPRDSIAFGAAGRPQGPPLHSGTAADPRDSIASDAAGRPQGPPLHSGTAAGPPPLALRAGLYTLRLLARARLPGWRNTCLYRAALHCLLLRRAGRPAILRIGARPGGSGDAAPVAAHAWVELLGQEIPAEAHAYTPLRRSTAPA